MPQVKRHQRYLRFTIKGAQAKGYGFSSKAEDTQLTYDRKTKMLVAVGEPLKDKHARERPYFNGMTRKQANDLYASTGADYSTKRDLRTLANRMSHEQLAGELKRLNLI